LSCRAVTVIVDNYHQIFTNHEDLLDCIPKPLRKEIFSRLVNRGVLVNELFARVVDKNESCVDFKSVAGLNDDSCRILSHCKKASTIFLTDVGASSEGIGENLHNHYTNNNSSSSSDNNDPNSKLKQRRVVVMNGYIIGFVV